MFYKLFCFTITTKLAPVGRNSNGIMDGRCFDAVCIYEIPFSLLKNVIYFALQRFKVTCKCMATFKFHLMMIFYLYLQNIST